MPANECRSLYNPIRETARRKSEAVISLQNTFKGANLRGYYISHVLVDTPTKWYFAGINFRSYNNLKIFL